MLMTAKMSLFWLMISTFCQVEWQRVSRFKYQLFLDLFFKATRR